MLCVNGAEGPVLAHVPFVMAADGTFVDLHLARSNGIIAVGLPAAAVLAVSGADHYVSPDWYGMADQVPTWNYIAVHLRGSLIPMPPETLEPHLDALSALQEAGLAPKPAWTSAKMSDGVTERMMRMILPFRLVIGAADGTWKLNQNKPAAARSGVISAQRQRDGIALAKKALGGD